MSSLLTILGMYNYDDTIFDDMVVPSLIDKNVLIRNIISELAEVEILYSDPHYLKYAITNWSYKEISVWERLADTYQMEYNPLYNVDATEYTKESRDLKNTEVGSNTGTSTDTGSSTDTTEGTNNNIHKVVGFNDGTLTNANKDEGDMTSSSSTTSSSSNTSSMNSNINRTDKGDIITEHRRYGNIGVTKSTDLVLSEFETRPKLNMYNFIIDSFKSRFCLMIY